jgi:hypothetical protein
VRSESRSVGPGLTGDTQPPRRRETRRAPERSRFQRAGHAALRARSDGSSSRCSSTSVRSRVPCCVPVPRPRSDRPSGSHATSTDSGEPLTFRPSPGRCRRSSSTASAYDPVVDQPAQRSVNARGSWIAVPASTR